MMESTVSVIGLGYVGLPVALAFGQRYPTVGFDINRDRAEELSQGIDRNQETSAEELTNKNLMFTSDPSELARANFHIVAVPTPIDAGKQPDLSPLISATRILGPHLKVGDTVVYESTVYPGVTEYECLPLLEQLSGLKAKKDFHVGYSPERINPGDLEHTFTKIKKVVSGQDEAALARVAQMYGEVVEAGVFKAASIQVAEAAKVIENTQRDLNIALMNELSLIFDRMNIDTRAVLDAAGTKWNFMPFTPGLVGGHCIGVDPYYLTHIAEKLHYHPQVILAGRRINDGMGKFVAQKTIKEMIRAGHHVLNSTVSIMGITFKPNVCDIRNTRVVDIVSELQEYGVRVQVCDPLADPVEVKEHYGISLFPIDDMPPAEAIVLAVGHRIFQDMGIDRMKALSLVNPVLVDINGTFTQKQCEQEGFRYWRL